MKRAVRQVLASRPLAYTFFLLAGVVATAPVWSRWLFGFNPSLDQALRLAICSGGAP